MRNLSIDYLKLILAYMVVLLHSGFLVEQMPQLGFLLVNGLFRLAVPLFLIISGYYFLKINSLQSLKPWLKRVLLLYLIWMLLYSPIWFHPEYPKEMLETIFWGYFTLWYLISLFFAGIVLYLLRDLKPQLLLVLAMALYVFGYLLQLAGNLHLFAGPIDGWLNWAPIYRNFLLDGFPLLAVGFLIHKLNLEQKFKPSLLLLCLAVGLVLVESWINYHWAGPKQYTEKMLSLLLAAPIIFLYVKNLTVLGNSKQIANFSTAVFLIHALFLHLYQYSPIALPKTVFVLVCSSIAAYLLVLLNKKLKYLL